eukprot:164188-Pelagomonas_calceolata.AAC.5
MQGMLDAMKVTHRRIECKMQGMLDVMNVTHRRTECRSVCACNKSGTGKTGFALMLKKDSSRL